MRVGHGYDVHAYGPGDCVIVGGVRIPYPRGVVAHSDGDVAIHALCDALLGAAGLGDIGSHFPDTDPKWQGADSRDLLRHVVWLIEQLGLQVGNADITVIAQAPKLKPHIEQMCAHLASDLGVSTTRVNLKATTTERLGFIGREEGIAAEAVVLLVETGNVR
ncbi:MAG: 2-C-methyl-D-erythritol 2,4-cyclodiphosphate synthase [Pseudomonadota bacterium]|nr:2-C-methyl-D-erythritol 2,4-cyclodiphosphate synthase [Pseudomonadota bacterium]